jgi:predicted dehydrogenase
MGNTHARQYAKMPDVEVGYHDRQPERGESFRDRWQASCCKSSDELIAWADVVDICLPTHLHLEYALKTIAMGKPLFLEKPLARSMDEAIKIIEAADHAGVPLMVGQVVRYFPEYAAARKAVRSGSVGNPGAVRLRRGGPTPQGHNLWFMDHGLSGGVLLDLAIHDFDWLRWTLGPVKHLCARSVGAHTGSGPDYALTTLTFECGAVAHVESTWMDPGGFRTTFEVAGSKGMIQYDSRETPALRMSTGGPTRNETMQAERDDPYYLELRAFLNAIFDNAPVPVPGTEGLNAMAISLAAIESAHTGKLVRPEQF